MKIKNHIYKIDESKNLILNSNISYNVFDIKSLCYYINFKTYSINMDSAATAFAFSTEDNFTYGTETFWVYASGDVTAAGNVTAYSDIKLKTDVATIDNALDKVSKMRGVMYTRKDTGLRGTGVIAQEIQEVLPEVVMEGETLSVAYGNIVGVLIEAIKELEARVKQLENK